MSQTIERDVFVDALSSSLDSQQAMDTLELAAERTGLDWRSQYAKEEALELAHALTELDDVKLFVNVAGNTLKARIESGQV